MKEIKWSFFKAASISLLSFFAFFSAAGADTDPAHKQVTGSETVESNTSAVRNIPDTDRWKSHIPLNSWSETTTTLNIGNKSKMTFYRDDNDRYRNKVMIPRNRQDE